MGCWSFYVPLIMMNLSICFLICLIWRIWLCCIVWIFCLLYSLRHLWKFCFWIVILPCFYDLSPSSWPFSVLLHVSLLRKTLLGCRYMSGVCLCGCLSSLALTCHSDLRKYPFDFSELKKSSNLTWIEAKPILLSVTSPVAMSLHDVVRDLGPSLWGFFVAMCQFSAFVAIHHQICIQGIQSDVGDWGVVSSWSYLIMKAEQGHLQIFVSCLYLNWPGSVHMVKRKMWCRPDVIVWCVGVVSCYFERILKLLSCC